MKSFLTWQGCGSQVGHPKHLWHSRPWQKNQCSTIRVSLWSHFQSFLHIGINVSHSNHHAWVVNLDQTFHARIHCLYNWNLRIRCPRESPHVKIKNLKPPLLANHLRPLESGCGLFTRAELAPRDRDVGLLADSRSELVKKWWEGLDFVNWVGIEECINLLRVHCSPLCDIAGGQRLPPLVVPDLDSVFEDHRRFGNICKPVFTVTPCFLVVLINWKNKRPCVSVLLKRVTACFCYKWLNVRTKTLIKLDDT